MKLRTLLAVLAGLALFLAACGGDDDSSEDGAAADDVAEDVSDDDASADDESGDDDPGDVEIPSGVDLGECGFMFDFSQDFAEEMASGGFGTSDGMASIADAFAAISDNAPSEISDDFEVMSDYFTDVAEALDGLDLDFSDPSSLDPEVFGQYESAMSSVDDSGFSEASENVTAWMEANCGDAFDVLPFG